MIKKWNEFNENYSQDEKPGKILLYFNDDSPTSWYYINDAIIDGLFIEKLDLNDDDVEEFGKSVNIEYYEYMDMIDLVGMIINNEDETFKLLFDWMVEEGIIDKHPTIRIKGKDEDGEKYNITYYPEK